MKKLLFSISIGLISFSCGNDHGKSENQNESSPSQEQTPAIKIENDDDSADYSAEHNSTIDINDEGQVSAEPALEKVGHHREEVIHKSNEQSKVDSIKAAKAKIKQRL